MPIGVGGDGVARAIRETFDRLHGSLAQALTSDLEVDTGGWQYAMSFRRVRESEDRPAKEADAILLKVFSGRITDEWKRQDARLWERLRGEGGEEVMVSELHDIVFNKCIEVLTGQDCGFDVGWQVSVDDDDVFLKIRLADCDNIKHLASKIEMEVPISTAAYDFQGLSCMQIDPTWGQLWGLNKELPPRAAKHLIYSTLRAQAFRENRDAVLEEVDTAMRLIACGDGAPARELGRQSHKRLIMLAALVAKIEKLHEHHGASSTTALQAQKDQLELVFNQINEEIETDIHESCPRRIEHNRDIQSITDPQEKLNARLERWSKPHAPGIDKFREAELYADFTDLAVMKIMYHVMTGVINLEKMKEFELLDGFFAIHKEDQLEKFKASWASVMPWNILQWPGTQWDYPVREYFGEQVAFFFSWLSMLTRQLIIPAIIAIVFRLRLLLFNDWVIRAFEFFYAIIMVVWCALFVSSWKNQTQTNAMLWGMLGHSSFARDLPDHRPELRGSWRETGMRFLHWLIVSAFIIWTLLVAAYMSTFRQSLSRTSEEHADQHFELGPFQLEKGLLDLPAKYAVTINIKIVAWAWSMISPRISRLENHRTFQERKDEQVFKNFLVNFIVYYYPFFYLAFLKHWVEGTPPRKCVEDIRTNLLLYFVIHIVTVIAYMAVSLLSRWWSKREERKELAAKGQVATHSHVEDMSKKEPYLSDEDDYLELMISLGFITMFAVILPGIAVVAFISCLLELRLQAWRLVWVRQRPVPMGQDGIGAWEDVMPFISNLSATVSVALLIFTREPISSQLEWPLAKKLIWFIIGERLMQQIVKFVWALRPAESAVDHDILQQHQDIYKRLVMSQQDHQVKKGRLERLQDASKLVTPGQVLPNDAVAAAASPLRISTSRSKVQPEGYTEVAQMTSMQPEGYTEVAPMTSMRSMMTSMTSMMASVTQMTSMTSMTASAGVSDSASAGA